MTAVRLASERDIPAMLAVYAPFVERTTVSLELEAPSPREFAERFGRTVEQFPWLCCEADGALAGYAYAAPAFERTGYQWTADVSVYIDPQYQRRGIAAALYLCLESFLQLQGYCRLLALITGDNEASMRFHETMGYRRLARFERIAWKLGGWRDIVWYEKALRECPGEPAAPLAFPALDTGLVEEILQEFALR